MHLLLPPSETKTGGGRGRALRTRLLDDTLGRGRRTAAEALARLVAGDPQEAADALLLPPGVAAAALVANAAALDSPTMPALRRYAGVVYDGLALDTMTPAQQRVAGRRTLIFSGLFGVVRGDEPVPDYRVPAKATLPGLGIASTFWRPRLNDVVPALVGRGLVVDLRSGDYAAMWRSDRVRPERTVSVRILSPAPRGGHAVISYTSKFAKGLLAAALIRRHAAGTPARDMDDVVSAWADCGGVDAVVRSPSSVDLYTV